MTGQQVTPERWLTVADRMLSGSGGLGAAAVAGGWWPRACACLIRLALEAGIEAYWQRVNPAVVACTRGRTRLLLLRARNGPGLAVARRAAYAWATLSQATHHRGYETVPAATELRHLHTEVTSLLDTLQRCGVGLSSPYRR
ncbi:MAG TPA: hypothetical protein VFX60_08770 [Micromonospora sp.]|nr:hypothetical protein [Micromonospora sp.]